MPKCNISTARAFQEIEISDFKNSKNRSEKLLKKFSLLTHAHEKKISLVPIAQLGIGITTTVRGEYNSR